MIEALKHGAGRRRRLLRPDRGSHFALLGREPDALTALVRRSVELKGSHRRVRTSARSGVQAVLNAGHTVGHALEHWSEYHLGHEDAVGLGLVVESFWRRPSAAPANTAALVEARLAALGSSKFPPATADGDLLDLMRLDKRSGGPGSGSPCPGNPGPRRSGPTAGPSKLTDDDVRQALGSARKAGRYGRFHNSGQRPPVEIIAPHSLARLLHAVRFRFPRRRRQTLYQSLLPNKSVC
ncbi:MAG: hypothetical protein R2882_15625 [Gemmatimonadales bacterium]